MFFWLSKENIEENKHCQEETDTMNGSCCITIWNYLNCPWKMATTNGSKGRNKDEIVLGFLNINTAHNYLKVYLQIEKAECLYSPIWKPLMHTLRHIKLFSVRFLQRIPKKQKNEII